MKTIIYTLSDDSNIRYIGKTINLEKRYKTHLRESRFLRTYKEKWINNVLLNGGKITIEVLDVCEEEESNLVECYWISQFKAWGFNLVNLTNGGDGGSPMKGKYHSHETKLKMSEIGKTQIRKLGGWNKNIVMNDDFKEKVSIAMKGHVVSDETKLKISTSSKGKIKPPMSNETKLKISNKKKGMVSPNKGKKFDDEIKLKMSQSKVGIKRNDDVKKILSECKKMTWVIKSPNGEIMNFLGYDSFKQFVNDNCLNVSVTTLKSYGKNKGWVIIDKIKKKQ